MHRTAEIGEKKEIRRNTDESEIKAFAHICVCTHKKESKLRAISHAVGGSYPSSGATDACVIEKIMPQQTIKR